MRVGQACVRATTSRRASVGVGRRRRGACIYARRWCRRRGLPHIPKQTYLAAQYRRLAKRMSKKKALVAVGHSLLVIVYHVLKNRASYQELGGDYFDRQHVEAQRARLIRKLETLGLKVTVEELPQAA